MTKETYFEMCETLSSEPVEEEIPVEYEDLTFDSQYVIYIFNLLPDRWSDMSGTYMGKDLTSLTQFFDIFSIPKANWLLYIQLLGVLTEENTLSINRKSKSKVKFIK